MDSELKIKKLDRDLLEADISLILLKLVDNSVDYCFDKSTFPDVDKYSRKILAFIKEHSVR